MSKSYIEVIINNTKIAQEQWNQFALECDDIDIFKKKFHLRPTIKGVTIVSTLDEKSMRGILCAKTKVKETLKRIYELTINDNNLMDELEKLGFQKRKRDKEKIDEEKYQAQMIVGMSGNEALKEYLKVEKLIFIASEFILHDSNVKSKRERIDIVGFDGINRLFFFELKHPDNTKDNALEQVKRYVDKYSEEKNKKDMLSVLEIYPINSISSNDIVIEGYAVYGYSEISKFEECQYKGGLVRFIPQKRGGKNKPSNL